MAEHVVKTPPDIFVFHRALKVDCGGPDSRERRNDLSASSLPGASEFSPPP
jgi:hypothetical protein